MEGRDGNSAFERPGSRGASSPVRFLGERGYAFVDPDEYLTGSGKLCFLSFDDNYRSWLRALPILEKYRARATFYLNSWPFRDCVSKADVRDWVYQLMGQGVLLQVGDEYPLLRLNESSWEVMRGQRQVRLVRMVRRKKGEKPEKSRVETTSWEGVDREVFEVLRRTRRDLASDRQVSPFIIFTDNTLRELARVRPSTLERMRLIPGVGDKRLRDFGERFLAVIADQCRQRGLAQDVTSLGRKP